MIFDKARCSLLLTCLVMIAAAYSGCQKDIKYSTATPVINRIRSYVASPGDSVLKRVGTGQWIVISGQNLKGALQINIDGVKASFNDAWFSDTSAIVLIPSVIAFPTVPANQLNTIQYITTHGQTTFSFPIVAPAPTISGISDESANPGDSVRIMGFNFFFIQSITYAGLPITSYSPSIDGTSITLAVPAGVTQTGGVVSVVTKSGTATTVYTVHDFVTGVVQNYDNINNFSFGSGNSNSSANYPGNTGYYGIINGTNVAPYDFAWYNYPRSINLNAVQWVPTANLSDPLANWAVKFEIDVTKPWSNGSIFIDKDYSFKYLARYAPWKNANGTTTPFVTKGWQTVTIPFSSFGLNYGAGNPPTSIGDLVGNGKGALNIYFINDTGTPVALFEGAFDNIRIVKIK
jgi:hypothetical protein